MKKTMSTAEPPIKVVLVGVTLPGITQAQTQAHLEELAELARTRGMEPLHFVMQKRERLSPSTKIGKGKVEEVAALVQADGIGCVVFDDELSPAQLRNLEKRLDCRVIDRTLLILEIFAHHARTAQARTQVELAHYQYLLPRLTRMWTHLSRQGGGRGSGMQGTGEKELETDRRIVQEKIHRLKGALAAIAKQKDTQRVQRNRFFNVALVGYTNAGKSTLMNRMARADVSVENKLFATLTTTVRKVVIERRPFLLSDTVGFIRKLPHSLVASFKTTLAEACHADLLLHVVDFSHPCFGDHIETVRKTLQEIGAGTIPLLLIFNKIDRLEGEQDIEELEKQYSLLYEQPVICISAQEGMGIERLHRHLTKVLVKSGQKLVHEGSSSVSAS